MIEQIAPVDIVQYKVESFICLKGIVKFQYKRMLRNLCQYLPLLVQVMLLIALNYSLLFNYLHGIELRGVILRILLLRFKILKGVIFRY